MSGFLAMLDVAGAPIDEELLAHLTRRMAYRGPDGSASEAAGTVGFGYTLLATSDAAHDARQPLWLGNRFCIVADARVDDRRRYAGELAGDGRVAAGSDAAPTTQSDAQLILHGYAAWGPAVLDRLAGDFAFALWDAERGRLFCARDQLGVKPLYYAQYGSTLLVSNSVRCLRAHPAANDRLDELSIADYLVFSFNRHPERSAFAQIKRLPAGHTLTVAAAPHRAVAAGEVRRYWNLPRGEPIRYRRDGDYLMHFKELLRAAVADRLREARAGVLMSGGIDSTTVAAIAAGLTDKRAGVSAFTYHHGASDADAEADYAAIVADHLGIPLRRLDLARDGTGELWFDADAATPEPMTVPMTRHMAAFFRDASAGTRVGLTGMGADPLSHLLPEDAAGWLRRHPWRGSLQLLRYRLRNGRLPRAGLRTAVRRRVTPAVRYRPVYPPWLRPELEQRLQLRRRFELLHEPPAAAGALRPAAHAIVSSPDLTSLLEGYDPGYTKFAADVRHPWLDLRLVDFMLRLPPIPWCVEKELVRRAMRNELPAATLARRKAPLPDYPLFAATVDGLPRWIEMAANTPRLAEFIDTGQFLRIAKKPKRLRPAEYEVVTRPLGLALWLRQFDEGTHAS